MISHVRLSSILACALALSISAAHSQQVPDTDLPDAKPPPPQGQAPKAPDAKTPKAKNPALKPQPEFELAKDLDGLFLQLKRTSDERRAGRISTRIWELWQTSDSKSVDLLAGWARKAMGEKKFAQALDLLDQVVVLRPDYSEAWNQRATLHFMMNNYNKSLVDIERTLALEPRHFGALAGMARILERLGQRERALKTWYRVLEVYPANQGAQKAVLRLEEAKIGSKI